MSTQPPAWLPDPYGRFQQRYWDGTDWTAEVDTGGARSIDPLGASTVVPFSIPESAIGSRDSTSGNSVLRLLDTMGPEARHRAEPRLTPVLSGIGGAVVAVGLVVAVNDEPSRVRYIIAALAILLGAYAIRFGVKSSAELRGAAVGGAVVAIPVLGAGIAAGNRDTWWVSLLIGVMFITAWLLPGLKGRPILLGLGALLLGVGVVEGIDSISTASAEMCQRTFATESYEYLPIECRARWDDITNLYGLSPFSEFAPGIAYLVCGAALLGAVWYLDRKKYHGVATSLVAAGVISSVAGVVLVMIQLDLAMAAPLTVLTGLFVGFVGSYGERRAATWWGAVLTTCGVLNLLSSGFEPSSSRGTAAVFILAGVMLVVAAAVGSAIKRGRPAEPPADAP